MALMRPLDPNTLEFLAELICGDGAGLKYRKGWEIPEFFRRSGLRCPNHDGTTRKWWTLERLKEYNTQPGSLDKIVLRLASPKEYSYRETFERVLDLLNQRLMLEGYQSCLRVWCRDSKWWVRGWSCLLRRQLPRTPGRTSHVS